MIPRLAEAFRGLISSDALSDATPTTVASGVAALKISDPEHSEDQGTSTDTEQEKQKRRSRRPPQENGPTVSGTDFRSTKTGNLTEPRQQIGHKAQGANRSHLFNAMVPREDAHAAKDKTLADSTQTDAFFFKFTAVEDYHGERIILPGVQSSDGNTGSESGDTSQSYESAQIKLQVSNLVEERDKIVSELFKQKDNFERIMEDLKKQKDELNGENETLKVALNELRSKLDASDTSVLHLVSEHKRMDTRLSHAKDISAQHQLESETLQRTVLALKEESSAMLREREAIIEELKTKCEELDKKIVSLNAAHLEEIQRADKNKEDNEQLSIKLSESETLVKKLESEKDELANSLDKTREEHENGMQTLKAKSYDAMVDHKKNMEVMETKNADLEEEIRTLKTSLKDQETRRAEERSTEGEETAVESETPETPDRSKASAVLGKRRMVDSDSAEPQEKKSRHGLSDRGTESTRGRSGFRDRVIGRFLGKSHSRPRTPEIDEARNQTKIDEHGSIEKTPGSVKKGINKGSEAVFSPFGLGGPSGSATLTPPESIAPSTSITSTGTSNNADDEASVFGDDDGVKSSPAGVSGTPKIAITMVDAEKDHVLVNVGSATVFDSAESAGKNELKWPPPKARSVSRERPSHIKPGEEPVSPTPVSATHRKSRSPFPQLRRPAPTHVATAPNPTHHALSPPLSAPRRVTSPGHQATSQSKKRKQTEPDLKPALGPVIDTYYSEYDDSDRKQAKKNRIS